MWLVGYSFFRAASQRYQILFKEEGISLKFALEKTLYLRMLHCKTFGQSKHSSGNGAPFGSECSNPEKCAHFAGESKTFGYSVAFTPTIFKPSVAISSLDMQCGHA
jgi:hypothetical protein